MPPWRTMRQYVAYDPPHHITQYRVSIPRTCTGAELFQLWTNPRDFVCMFISNGLTILKRSPAWPTQSLKLSRVQVYHVTIFPIRLKMGLCADTQCLQVASMVINLLISNLLHSCASFNLFITLINDGFLSWVTRLQRFIRSFDVAVCARLSWGLATWREAVEEDCQSAIYKASRPVCCIASHHEPRPDQLHNSTSSHQWQSSPIFGLLQ